MSRLRSSSLRRTTLLALSSALIGTLAPAQTTVRVSVGPGGAEADAGSTDCALSADGRIVVFTSMASNLAVNDTRSQYDAFAHDRRTGTNELINVSTAGVQGEGGAYDVSISADGRFVAFSSEASNLVPNDGLFNGDVYVRDRIAGTTQRLSNGPAGVPSNQNSYEPTISADGRFVAFLSGASNLVAGDTNGRIDVFVADVASGALQRVSVNSGGGQANAHTLRRPGISDDGRYVVFESLASNLVVGDLNESPDVFLHDRLTGTIELVSVTAAGLPASGPSSFLATRGLSSDGRFVAFWSPDPSLVPGDTNGWDDVFVRDRVLLTTERVSVDSAGLQGNRMSRGGTALSSDGRYVAFVSMATNLVPGDTNGREDMFVHDRLNGTTVRVNVSSSGAEADTDFTQSAALSSDGRYLAFVSAATNLVANDLNAAPDVFVHELGGPPGDTFCSGDGALTDHTTPCPCGNNGAPGRGCANSVQPAGALLSTSGSIQTDAVVLEGSDMPSTVTCIYFQGDGLDDAVFGDGVRCVGGLLVRLSTKSNVSGGSAFPDAADTVTLSARGGVAAWSGLRRSYQVHYRNAAPLFCPPATFNVTNGVVIDW
ncbi:MAG: hypothetical protein ACKV2T_44055 [Kofleriaceae bacterium]